MDRAFAHATRATAMGCAVQAIGGGLGWSLVPALMPLMAKDLGISHAAGGVVWGAAPLGIAIASPLGGAAVDRYGARRVAGVAMVAGALACAARALATGPWSLAAAMLAFGAHVGFVAPAVPKALASHVPQARFARANGIALVGYTLGTAATVLAAPTVLAPLFGGWRGASVAAGVAMAVVGALWAALVEDRAAPVRHAGIGDVLRLARAPRLARVAVMQLLLFGGYLALLGMLPRALAEGGLPVAKVGGAVAAWLTTAGLANFVGPWLSDRLGTRRGVILLGSVVAGASLVALAVAGVGASSTAAWLSLAAAGGGLVAPLLLVLPAEIAGPQRAGAAVGLLMLVGQVGGFFLPALTGLVTARAGASAAVLALSAAHFAIVIPAFGLRTRGASLPAAA